MFRSSQNSRLTVPDNQIQTTVLNRVSLAADEASVTNPKMELVEMTPVEIQSHEKFLRLFTANEPAVRAFVRRLVPSQADADDIMQEIAITLWNKFDEFRPDANFRTWAFAFAKFKVLAWIRDHKRDRLVLANDVVEMIVDDAQRADIRLQRQRELLENCFGKVPLKDRELLSLAYQPDAIIKDVAQTSGRSVPGFYQWMYRIRQQLQDCVHRELAREALS